MAAVAVNDIYGLIQGQPLVVTSSGVAANDALASGNPVSVVGNTNPTNGTLAISAGGNFTYTPAAGFAGQDSFGYTISDGLGNTSSATVTLDVAAIGTVAADVVAGPRLASVDSTQGALLNSLLGGLLGTGLAVDVLDWNALAGGDVNASDLVEALRVDIGAATSSEALGAEITLGQLLDAAATAAQAEGDTALVTAFNNLGAKVDGLAGTVRLGDLLQVDPNDGSFVDAGLDALDLVTGGIQLFNFENVASTSTPISVSGAALGLGSIINSATLSAVVVEPPVHVIGGAGTSFHTAATRLRLDLDLVDIPLDTNSLAAALLGPLQGILGPLVSTEVDAEVGQLSLYVEVAGGGGIIETIDALANAVTLQATPGVASLYLGNIPDAVFTNRTAAIDPASILSDEVGSLAVRVNLLGSTIVDTTAGVALRGVALGQVLTPESRLFDGAFPETQTFGNSANFVSDLLSSLAAGLEVELTGPLASPVNGLVDAIVLPLLRTPVAGTLAPVLATVLTGVADPALGTLGVGIGELDVTVSPIALAPLPAANSDFVGTPEDSPANIAVLGNDASSPAGSASVISFTQPANGTTTLNPDGTITYTPNANFFGSDSFTYTIRDANGGTSTATVVVQVSAVNDPPIAVADAYAATEDTPLVVPSPGVLANDTDAEGTSLTAVLVSGPSSGALVLNPDGSFTYTPGPNFSGADSFTYQASDGVSLSAPVAVAITVEAANDAPVANPDAFSVEGDTPLVVAGPGLLANDVDTEGDVLGAGVASGPSNGTLTLNPDGSFTYIPDLGFTGTDSFTYQASDGTATSAPATVTITVGVSNTVPVAVGDAYGATEDTPLVVGGPGVLGNDTDGDGDPLTAVLVQGPANGTLTLNPDGSFTYTPGPNFNGADSFTYQASDGLDQSAPVTVAIAVGAANDAPVANPDAYGATEDTPLVVVGPGVLANDFDPEGGGLGAGVVAGPSNGTLVLNPDGSFTYTPEPGFSGVDSFTYQASDGDLLSPTATVTITVDAANDAPLTIADAYTTTEDTPLVIAGPGVLTNDIDPDGDPLSAVLVSGPANGTLTLNPDGSFTYTPNPNFTGADSFTYQASDGVSLGAPATVTITVGAVNDTPVANPDAYSVTEDRELRTPRPGVLANDIDPDGDTLTAVLVSGPANGTLVLNPDGSFTYTPNPNFNGADSFTYQASDGVSLSAPVTVSLTVGAANDAPIANPDTYPGTEDTPLVVPGPGVLGNDSDADGDPLVPIVVAGPTNGSLTVNPDGSFNYTPNPNFNGTDSFTYQASDGTSLSLPVTVSIVVGAVNDAPSAADDNYTLTPGQPLIIGAPGVLGNDTDVEGSPLTAIIVTGPSNGSLTLNPDGSFTYTPNPGFAGTDSFSYRASDGTSPSSIATVSVVTRAATIPQIVSLVRLGFHRQPTQIVLAFNVDMDPAGAQNLANYQLVTPGRDGRFGTRDDRRMPLKSAIYNAANRTVTLQARALLPLNGRYRLTVRDGTAGGLSTTGGVALDGNLDGIAGGAAAIEFNRSALAGPSVPSAPQRGRVVQPRQVVQPTIRQVDPLAAQMFVNSPWVPMAIKRRFLN